MIKKKESDAIPIENQLGLVLSKEAKSYLASLSMPSDKYISDIFEATVTNIVGPDNIFIAPANGYISVIVRNFSSILGGYMRDGHAFELFRIGRQSGDENADRFLAPISKNDQFYIRKGDSSSDGTINSYFIYAKGEVE